MTSIRPNEPIIDPTKHIKSGLKNQIALLQNRTYTNTVGFIAARQQDGSRMILTQATLCTEKGVVQDRWHLDLNRDMNEQIAAMNIDVARVIANGQSLTLFGDALFLDIDMRIKALPLGSKLCIGNCVLQVTPEAHNPCSKFRSRFGNHAFQICVQLSDDRIRGVYLRVIKGGVIALGDSILISIPE